MEKIEKILEFIRGSGDGDGSGSGYGYGYGDGSGDGDGSGSGSGYGYGYGYGDGDGSGSGYGYGDGDGSGSGDGDGYGYGDGSGYGYGYGNGSGSGYGDGSGDGSKIIKLNKDLVFYVDSIPTIFNHIHNNIAKGCIVNEDFSLMECYIVKGNGYFAHGGAIKQALKDLQSKILDNMNTEEKLSKFKKKFNNIDKYVGEEFFEWHHILTGSCLEGRKSFVESNGLSLNDKYTVREFLSICENSYGGEIIKRLKQYYN